MSELGLKNIKNDFNEAGLASMIPIFKGTKYDTPYSFVEVVFNDELKEFSGLEYVQNAPYANAWKENNQVEALPHHPHLPILTNPEAFNALLTAYTANITDAHPRAQQLQASIREKFHDVFEQNDFKANCYAYALGDYNNAIFLTAHPGGKSSGITLSYDDLTKETIIKLSVKDGLNYAGTDPNKLEVPENQRIVMLYVDEETDYHWVRLDSDKEGNLTASDKMGLNSPKTEMVDDIYDLMDENFGREYEFAGFFYVPNEGIDVGKNEYLNLSNDQNLNSQAYDNNIVPPSI